jgi:hypothetical protein
MKLKWMHCIVFLSLISMIALAQDTSKSPLPAEEKKSPLEALLPDHAGSVDRDMEKKTAELVSIQPTAAPLVRHLWGDVDSDGLQDLFVLDLGGNLLFKNIGNGDFEDVTALAFPEGAGQGVSGFFGDYNSDDKVDLFLFHSEGFTLYRNDGNLHFLDVTENLGFKPSLPIISVQLNDYDQDGHDDLIVETPQGDRIFRNHEGRSFSEVRLPGTRTSSKKYGLTPPMKTPGGPVSPAVGMKGWLTADEMFINDNSPDSVGIGIPEVEGGSDAVKDNDIVDGTVAGTDLKKPFNMEGAQSNWVFRVINENTDGGHAIFGHAKAATGAAHGLHGKSDSEEGKGVLGYATSSTGTCYGVFGKCESEDGYGVYGIASSSTSQLKHPTGVYGTTSSDFGYGVHGIGGKTGVGVFGEAGSPSGFGVKGYVPSGGTGSAIYGHAPGADAYAGLFNGRAKVNGRLIAEILEITGGSDLSEQFDIQGSEESQKPQPGMVVVIDPDHPGDLTISDGSYDRRVAGVISGAGGVKPGMLMGQEGTKADGKNPVALTGRVYCYADAANAPIVPGDLLTTSDLPGHAMKVLDHEKAQGAVLGKAMTELASGQGLVLVLVSLQ